MDWSCLPTTRQTGYHSGHSWGLCQQDDLGDAECEIIDSALEDVYANAPPQQTRDFKQYVYLFGAKPRQPDKLNWQYIVSHTYGGSVLSG
jgi:hypothetical protein